MTARVGFCPDHWARLRAAIDDRGLSVLVSEGGEEAGRKLAGYLADGATIDNFDPLLAAYMAINEQCMRMAGPKIVEGATGPVCPLCRLNFLHDAQCTDPACGERPMDRMIDLAADGAVLEWKSLGSD